MKPIRLRIPWKPMRGRRRSLLFLVLSGGVLFGIFQFAILPVVESQRKVQEELVLKKKMLGRYDEYIKAGKDIEEELNQRAEQVAMIESKLLAGETPQINAANLQEILRRLSEKHGIQIRSFRMSEAKEMSFYVRIPVVIEMSPMRSMASLTSFLYDLEHYEKFLLISDLDLSAPNMRNPMEVQGNLTVVGFSKNLSPKGKAKEG